MIYLNAHYCELWGLREAVHIMSKISSLPLSDINFSIDMKFYTLICKTCYAPQRGGLLWSILLIHAIYNHPGSYS